MTTALIPFDGGAVPAHLAAMFDAEGNIAARQTIDQLSSRGKTWRMVIAGEETVLTRPSKDNPGESEPVPIVSLVVLDHNKGRSRAFYKGEYESGKNAAPDCYSGDGITPDASVAEPCAATCATCPNSVKGSKVSPAGKAMPACSVFKRLAVAPTGKIAEFPVMLLRLAQTSVWDKDNKENEAKGWYAWDQFLDMMRAKGVKHTASVECRVKFDTRAEYPKLLFNAGRWLNPDEASAAMTKIKTDADVIKKIITGVGDDDGVMGHAAPVERDPTPGTPGTATKTPAAAASVVDPAVAAAAAQQAIADQELARIAAEAEAEKQRKAAAKAKKLKAAQDAAAAAQAAAAAAAAAAESDDEDDAGDGGFGGVSLTPAAPASPASLGMATNKAAPVAETPAAAAPVAGAATVLSGTPAALADLLNNWDDPA